MIQLRHPVLFSLKKKETYLGIVWPMGLLFTYIFQRKLGLIFCDSIETSSLIFSEKNEKYLGIVRPMGLLFTFIFQRKLGLIFCDSLETSSLIFSEKKERKIFRNCVAHGPLVYFYLSKKIRPDFL